MFNTALGSDSYSISKDGEHLGSERARSLPRRHRRNRESWDLNLGHREHSCEQEESLPGESDILMWGGGH